MPRTHTLVQLLVGAALTLALAACVLLPLPDALPAVALGQPGLYRLEVALSLFYGCLLIITPAFSGLTTGRLPIEISTRGAKFAEETDQSAALIKVRTESLQRAANDLTEALFAAKLEIQRLRKCSGGDNAQRKVDSKS
ncbi:MAG TPA: hypothetical protein VFU16_02690 [Solirubrobacterales bacterium]|nr:hypothetical protein [Solirubrobacterales bacterium]